MVEVAARAGVSPVTVSRVLHTPSSVRSETRARVEAAIEELGYLPNLVARSLAATRSNMVAALVSEPGDPFFGDVLHAMDDVLSESGMQLMIGYTAYDPDREERLVKALLPRQPDAVFLGAESHTESTRQLLRNARLPVIEAGTLPGEPVDLAVGFSSRAAARAVIEHLAARGRRSIAYLHTPLDDNLRLHERFAGVEEGLRAAGMSADPALFQETDRSYAGGAAGVVALLHRRPEIDAVFCSTDELAAGVIFESQRRGWAIPDRLAVVGFHNSPLAPALVPTLTSVEVPRRRMGEIAARMILDRLEDSAVPELVIDVGFELIARASS
jgi:LacI family gluconate utilization system Gnt-I transcriptional repressor